MEPLGPSVTKYGYPFCQFPPLKPRNSKSTGSAYADTAPSSTTASSTNLRIIPSLHRVAGSIPLGTNIPLPHPNPHPARCVSEDETTSGGPQADPCCPSDANQCSADCSSGRGLLRVARQSSTHIARKPQSPQS